MRHQGQAEDGPRPLTEGSGACGGGIARTAAGPSGKKEIKRQNRWPGQILLATVPTPGQTSSA